MSFIEYLKKHGWSENETPFTFSKGSWNLAFDTSSWIEVGTKNTPRVFDVAVPTIEIHYKWTSNLIEHLCKTDDALTNKN